MKYKIEYLNCGDVLLNSLKSEIDEIKRVIQSIEWNPKFTFISSDKTFEHQTAYNKKFEIEFSKYNWDLKPMLSSNPKLIGDFQKDLVFVEVQFGNSATLYRDFYKFQYGHQKGLLSLGVLIVPNKPLTFFPDRASSISNMAEFDLALRYFTILPISVPTILIGLSCD